MARRDKKYFYFSSLKEVSQLIAEYIEPPSEDEAIAIVIGTIERESAKSSKERAHGKT